jgi:hypothetical protein
MTRMFDQRFPCCRRVAEAGDNRYAEQQKCSESLDDTVESVKMDQNIDSRHISTRRGPKRSLPNAVVELVKR